MIVFSTNSFAHSWTDPALSKIFLQVCYKEMLLTFLMMKYGNKCSKGGLNPLLPKIPLISFPFFLSSKYSAKQLEELLKLLNIINYVDLKWTFCTQGYEYFIRVYSVLSNLIHSKHKRITGHLCITLENFAFIHEMEFWR